LSLASAVRFPRDSIRMNCGPRHRLQAILQNG
jgi:hypothetical protein